MKFNLYHGMDDKRQCLMLNQDIVTINKYIYQYQEDNGFYHLSRMWFHWDKKEMVEDYGSHINYFYITWEKDYSQGDVIKELWP